MRKKEKNGMRSTQRGRERNKQYGECRSETESNRSKLMERKKGRKEGSIGCSMQMYRSIYTRGLVATNEEKGRRENEEAIGGFSTYEEREDRA